MKIFDNISKKLYRLYINAHNRINILGVNFRNTTGAGSEDYGKQVHSLFINTSMLEKEIKILDINYPQLLHTLDVLGAQKKGVCLIRDWYYDTDDKSLRKKGFRAKVRAYGTHRFELTTKEKVEGKATKDRIEKHIPLESIDAGHSLLTTVGLKVRWKKEKIRISYSSGDMIFDIDFYNGIPPLLEIEGPDDQSIFDWIQRLGLHNHMITSRGTKKLLRHYGQKVDKVKK